jgi:hypothetical protein
MAGTVIAMYLVGAQRQISPHAGVTMTATPRERQRESSWSITESVARRVGLFVCGLGGHDLVRSYENGRICLRCMFCAYETPGWTLTRGRHGVSSR